MTAELQQMIAAVRTLSRRDKLQLLQVIAQDLQQADALYEASRAFWNPQSLDEIARAQSAPVITNIRMLVADFWPEDETADDINQFISERRLSDKLREL